MPTPKSQSKKPTQPKKRDSPILTIIRRLFILALICLSGWLYWQTLQLRQDNVQLHHEVAVLKKSIEKSHKALPNASAAPMLPEEMAKIHLERAKSALDRKDYASFVANLDKAQGDIRSASSGATAETQRAMKAVTAQVDALRKQALSASGHLLKPSTNSPTTDGIR